MSEIMEPKIEEQPGEALSWSKVWISVITRPSVATFERIIRDPQASPGRAYLWVITSIVIGSIIQGLYSLPGFISAAIGSLTQGGDAAFGTSTGLEALGTPMIALICSPVVVAIQVVGLVIAVSIRQWVARRFFDGTGTYGSLIYTTAAYTAPLYLFSSLISGVPYLICLSIGFVIYSYVLDVMAVKAVNRIGWGAAVATCIVSYVLPVIVLAVITVCALTILGPAIGESFQNIMMNSGGAVP